MQQHASEDNNEKKATNKQYRLTHTCRQAFKNRSNHNNFYVIEFAHFPLLRDR